MNWEYQECKQYRTIHANNKEKLLIKVKHSLYEQKVQITDNLKNNVLTNICDKRIVRIVKTTHKAEIA